MKRNICLLLTIIIAIFAIIYFAFPEYLIKTAISVERKLANLEQKSIMVDGQNIAFLEGGSDKAITIVLVHGFSADKDNWTRFSKYMTPDYHVIALDLPGFGESYRLPDLKYDQDSQVDRLNRFVEALKIESFHLAGNSMGGHISALFSIKYPKKVLSLSLIDAGGVIAPNNSEFDKNLSKGTNLLLTNNIEDFERVINFVFQHPPFIPGPLKLKFAEIAVANKDFNQKIFNDLQSNIHNLEPKLSEIEAQTLIIWGENDRVLDVSCVSVFEKGIKKHKTFIIKDCGHLPMLEKPSETATGYKKFLSGLS